MSSEMSASTMKQEATNALVPKLRFPEFRGDEGWQHVTLNSIADSVRKRAVQSENNEVLSLSAEHGLVLQGNFFGKKVAGDNIERYLKIACNDFVYNDRITKMSTYGTIKRLSKYESGIVSPIYKCFRFKARENSVFWQWYFESGNHDAALHSLVNEGARAGRFNISISQFLSTIASRPEIAEQQKIADCLSSLDELIAVQARKVEALKTHKKGLMQQLFPREGESQPRLRFPEFQDAGEWELSLLSDLCHVKHGYAFESAYFSSQGEFILLTPGNFYEQGGYRDRGEQQKYFTGQIPQDYVLAKGDMLVAMTEQAAGLLGSPIIVPDSDKFLHNQRLGLVVKKPGVTWENEFFFHLFNSQYIRKVIHDTASGAKVRHTSPTKIGDILVSVPVALPEQQRIASCLSNLGSLITAETQKLEALKTHKKGLMQQLIPAPSRDEP